MQNYNNHSEKVKKRMEAISIKGKDTCAFFEEKAHGEEIRCHNCIYGDFENSGLDVPGYCAYGRGTVVQQQDLINAKQKLEALVSNIKGGVITCLFNPQTQSSKVVYINEGWTALTGYTQEELVRDLNGNPQALVFSEDKKMTDMDYAEQIQRGQEYELMYRVIRKDGSTIWVMDRGVVSTLEDGEIQNQSIITEITEMKKREERLKRLAQTDQLTGLNNKITFSLLAQKILERQQDKQHAVMLIDIDCFKGINDSMGHAFGDLVLQNVAIRLKKLVTKKDILGRTGGDEFMVFMTDIDSKEAAKQKAEQICKAMREVQSDQNQICSFSVCVGVSVFSPEKDYAILYEEADAAMYQAKNSGKGCSRFYQN